MKKSEDRQIKGFALVSLIFGVCGFFTKYIRIPRRKAFQAFGHKTRLFLYHKCSNKIFKAINEWYDGVSFMMTSGRTFVDDNKRSKMLTIKVWIFKFNYSLNFLFAFQSFQKNCLFLLQVTKWLSLNWINSKNKNEEKLIRILIINQDSYFKKKNSNIQANFLFSVSPKLFCVIKSRGQNILANEDY